MEQILVYSDSATWGIIPHTRRRLPFEQRWPGVLELRLNAESLIKYRVVEDCLNGRRTVWEDPFKEGRNGLVGLQQRIEVNSPLALLIFMLGTNDFQAAHQNHAWHSAQGLARLIQAARSAPVEPGMPIPPILVVSPPSITQPSGAIARKFAGAAEKCAGLASGLRQVCADTSCSFFDAASVTTLSKLDGIHLDVDQHRVLGESLSPVVKSILRGRADGGRLDFPTPSAANST
jgi:lysophospholipase L1-like esterase